MRIIYIRYSKALKLILKFLRQVIKIIPLLDRWLITEIFPPLAFALSSCLVLILSFGELLDLIRKMVISGLPLSSVIEILFFRLPGYLTLALPMATLLGCLLAFSKLNNNSEIKALRAIGIGHRRVIISAMCIGLAMSILTFTFNNHLAPFANAKADLALRKGLGQSSDIAYKRNIIYSNFNDKKDLDAIFFAEEYKDDAMLNITIVDYSEGKPNSMIVANKGIWNNKTKNWLLTNGTILPYNKSLNSERISFSEHSYKLNYGPIMIAKIPDSSNNMNLSQVRSAIELYKQSGNLKEERKLKVRFQEKFTVPLACLIFSIIGSTLAIKKSKVKGSGQSIAFGGSIILILFYYTVSFLFSSLGMSGNLHPFIAAWSPIGLFLLGGEYFIRQSY